MLALSLHHDGIFYLSTLAMEQGAWKGKIGKRSVYPSLSILTPILLPNFHSPNSVKQIFWRNKTEKKIYETYAVWIKKTEERKTRTSRIAVWTKRGGKIKTNEKRHFS